MRAVRARAHVGTLDAGRRAATSIVPKPQRHYRNDEGHLRSELEKSLERLGVDRVGLFYAHRREQERPVEELAETMALPRMPFQTFIDECETVQDAWKRVEFDPVAYGERRALLKSRIVKVMETEGIKVRGYQPA